MKRCKILILIALGALAVCPEARGQTDAVRLDEVERRVDRLDSVVKRVDKEFVALSRNDLENSRGGIVITDIKGISMKISGYVQADFMFDTRDTGNRYAFQTSSITTPTYANSAFTFSIRQSRLGFTASGPLKKAGDFYAILELDLYGPNDSYNPRIRHAWISIGKWGFGQYWSNFMDSNIWPNLVDYWGPNAYVWTRQVQARFMQPIGKHGSLAVSIEQPGSDVTFPDGSDWTSRNLYPDFTASYTYSWDDGNSHLRLAGLVHPITYRTDTKAVETLIGGAGNFSGNIRTWGRDAIKFQVSYGTGYARYSEDISGLGYDALPDAGGRLHTSTQLYAWIFYDRWWCDKLSSTIGWGNISVRNGGDYLPPTSIKQTNYGAVNLLWYPNKYFKTGIEVLYGNRKNLDGSRGEDVRIQWTAFITM